MKRGLIEVAHGGTLFLDEIGAMPIELQAKLLLFMEAREIRRVGGEDSIEVDVRVIAATNVDLRRMVAERAFREDLLYRLDVVKLVLPPLRQRKGDVPLLVHHFMEKYTAEMSKQVLGITNGAMRALLNHEWPGNVRELQNVIERAVIFAEGRRIGVEDLPFQTDFGDDDVGDELKDSLRQFERQHIMSSLRRYGYDKAETAKRLGIGISSLYRKLDELQIPKSPAGSDGQSDAGD
jgi:transcriptional regulator with PAS, ATPase and Fis domain